jgi:hypothetical protein
MNGAPAADSAGAWGGPDGLMGHRHGGSEPFHGAVGLVGYRPAEGGLPAGSAGLVSKRPRRAPAPNHLHTWSSTCR